MYYALTAIVSLFVGFLITFLVMDVLHQKELRTLTASYEADGRFVSNLMSVCRDRQLTPVFADNIYFYLVNDDYLVAFNREKYETIYASEAQVGFVLQDTGLQSLEELKQTLLRQWRLVISPSGFSQKAQTKEVITLKADKFGYWEAKKVLV